MSLEWEQLVVDARDPEALGRWWCDALPWVVVSGDPARIHEPGVWSYLANLLGMLVIVTKGGILVFVQIWVRWTLPRLRIDQVMTTCLKYCVPLAAICFAGATLYKLDVIPPYWSPHDEARYTWGRSFAETRESWVLGQNAATKPAEPAKPDEPAKSATPTVASIQEITP